MSSLLVKHVPSEDQEEPIVFSTSGGIGRSDGRSDSVCGRLCHNDALGPAVLSLDFIVRRNGTGFPYEWKKGESLHR